MAFCAGTTPTSPMAFSRTSTAWSRPPRPRLEATGPPATSRRSSTSSPASSNSAYPPETARSHFPALRIQVDQFARGLVGGVGDQAPRLPHAFGVNAHYGADRVVEAGDGGAVQHPGTAARADPVGGLAALAVGGGHPDVGAHADDEVERQLVTQHAVQLVVAEAAIGDEG